MWQDKTYRLLIVYAGLWLSDSEKIAFNGFIGRMQRRQPNAQDLLRFTEEPMIGYHTIIIHWK